MKDKYILLRLKKEFFFSQNIFIISHTEGIHCDISEYAYIVHCLASPLPSPSSHSPT
jgi:hypothetical protein